MSNYFGSLVTQLNDVINDYFIFIGGRNTGKIANTIPHLLEFLFGGTCIYHYEPQGMIHYYRIKNDDIGYISIRVTQECFVYEDINVRIQKMCEEYDSYMRYKYNYIRKEKELYTENK